MEQNHINRLLRLAEHLLRGKLGHREFNFCAWNGLADPLKEKYNEHGCGTMGCAAGELPILFPAEWEFAEYGAPVLIDSNVGPVGDLEKFFGIGGAEEMHLFHPEVQSPELYGGRVLPGNARKEEVAHNILLFLIEKTKRDSITLNDENRALANDLYTFHKALFKRS